MSACAGADKERFDEPKSVRGRAGWLLATQLPFAKLLRYRRIEDALTSPAIGSAPVATLELRDRHRRPPVRRGLQPLPCERDENVLRGHLACHDHVVDRAGAHKVDENRVDASVAPEGAPH